MYTGLYINAYQHMNIFSRAFGGYVCENAFDPMHRCILRYSEYVYVRVLVCVCVHVCVLLSFL